MRIIRIAGPVKLMIFALLSVGFVACGTSTTKKTVKKFVGVDSVVNETMAETDEQDLVVNKALANNTAQDLIISVYNKFVFCIDSDDDEINHPEKYFTANALRKLRHDSDYECDEEPCYAYYALRSAAQDSKPGSDETSRINNIKTEEDGWYMVSYSDMGWTGQTRVKIVDGKIDDYKRINDNTGQ